MNLISKIARYLFLILFISIMNGCKRESKTQCEIIHESNAFCPSWSHVDQLGGYRYREASIEDISIGSDNSVFLFVASTDWHLGYQGGYILKSLDGGKTWVSISGGTYDFSGPSTVFALNKDTVFRSNRGTTSFGVFQVSYDGGNSWTNKSINVTDYLTPEVNIHFYNSLIGFVGAPDQLFSTKDGGNSWESPDDLIGKSVKKIQSLTKDIVYLIADGSCYKTINGGSTWNMFNSGISAKINDLSFINEDKGVASSQDGVFITNDGGSSWSKSSDINTTSISYKDTSTIYVVNSDSILFSSYDAGVTWGLECAECPNTFTVVETNPNVAYLGSAIYGIKEIDPETSWLEPIPAPHVIMRKN